MPVMMTLCMTVEEAITKQVVSGLTAA